MNLKEIRKQLNLSREQLAILLEVSLKSIVRWESGDIEDAKKYQPKLKALVDILKYKKGEIILKEILSNKPDILTIALLNTSLIVIDNILLQKSFIVPTIKKVIKIIEEE